MIMCNINNDINNNIINVCNINININVCVIMK